MRIEFKKTKTKKSKFYRFCETNGADYFETDGYGIWIKPEFSKDSDGSQCSIRSTIKLMKNGNIDIGSIDESCLNFKATTNYRTKETQTWIIEILTLFQKYKPNEKRD